MGIDSFSSLVSPNHSKLEARCCSTSISSLSRVSICWAWPPLSLSAGSMSLHVTFTLSSEGPGPFGRTRRSPLVSKTSNGGRAPFGRMRRSLLVPRGRTPSGGRGLSGRTPMSLLALTLSCRSSGGKASFGRMPRNLLVLRRPGRRRRGTLGEWDP